jgi:putative salt-induced outer membrane protein YdiY
MAGWQEKSRNVAAEVSLFSCITPITASSQEDFVSTRFSALLLLLLAVPALADQIVLKNGDRLTGSIKKSDGKVVVIKTDAAGEVTVKFDAIQTLTSAGELSVTLGGKTVKGDRVTVQDEKVVVATKSGPVEAPKSTVTMMRNPEEQVAFEKSLHPGLLEGWNGGLNLGFALTRGNSQTKNLNIAFNAVRTGFHDKLLLYETSIYAANDLPTATPHTTANAVGGGVRYDHDLTPRLFAFVNGDFYHDGLQFLDLRAIFGGGLGVHVIKSNATVLDLLAGANYTHESYSSFVLATTPPTEVASVTRSLAGLTLGDSFVHKVGKGTVITQGLLFYPDLTHTGEYRGTFNLGTVTKINKWFGWQNSFADIYVSDPPGGTKKNDLQLATGLNFTFTH